MTQFERDMASDHRDLFLQVRDLLLTRYGFQETQKPRITTYANAKGGICHLRTMPHGIDIGFLKGAKMTDSRGLLTGKGKSIRVLPIQTYNQDHLTYYLKQAIELNR
ncbi:DUF1801 domain-containing protein [Labrenzia sp. PHM005]|uniref:DUF1801 domain-containing protein n=1 Tax=Labrenzia sp. PHM005 TaxID=2590016 RepID=UPI00114088B6|nr:DUF1801 domain-containing protein [Labrenzia sp. PHM005]QDG76454.1 DUF1801 domain-containing protein [Labrenzia sp. PHM005]